MKRVFIYCIMFFSLHIVAGCSFGHPPEPPKQESPAQSITVNGIEVSKLSRSKAEEKLSQEADRMLSRELSFNHNERQFSATLKELGVRTNVKEVLDQIYSPKPNSAKPTESSTHSLALSVDVQRAVEKLGELTRELNTPPKDAVLKPKMENNAVEIVPHSQGLEIDLTKTVQDLQKALSQQAANVELAVRVKEPAVKTEDLETQKYDAVVSSFSTAFAANEKNRSENLARAARAIDMTLLKPGEIFSFNKRVGPRNEATGYKDAPVIIQNELVPGIGGGICQVSSTLYNSALLADLEIVERHPHEFAIAYLPPGRDATVTDGNADLKFKNNTPGYILIRSEVKGAELKISFLGKGSNKKVELQTVIEETKPFGTEKRFDSSLQPGKVIQDQAGAKGYSTRTYRIVRVNNQEVKREEISKDKYKPANKIYRVGPSRGDWE